MTAVAHDQSVRQRVWHHIKYYLVSNIRRLITITLTQALLPDKPLADIRRLPTIRMHLGEVESAGWTGDSHWLTVESRSALLWIRSSRAVEHVCRVGESMDAFSVICIVFGPPVHRPGTTASGQFDLWQSLCSRQYV